MKNTFKNNHNYTLKHTHTFLLINYHACKEAFFTSYYYCNVHSGFSTSDNRTLTVLILAKGAEVNQCATY